MAKRQLICQLDKVVMVRAALAALGATYGEAVVPIDRKRAKTETAGEPLNAVMSIEHSDLPEGDGPVVLLSSVTAAAGKVYGSFVLVSLADVMEGAAKGEVQIDGQKLLTEAES